MNYRIRLINNTCYTPTYWSGGMATELITYPESSSFAERNFLWRMGFAKIDIDTSSFSSLPGVKRHLMVTDGEMTLFHQDRYSKLLKPFDEDFFMGDWVTTTKGRCSVLNLMTREDYDGTLTHISVKNKETKYLDFTYNINNTPISACIYSLNGDIVLNIEDCTYDIKKGDLLCIDIMDSAQLPDVKLINSQTDSIDLVLSMIFKNK